MWKFATEEPEGTGNLCLINESINSYQNLRQKHREKKTKKKSKSQTILLSALLEELAVEEEGVGELLLLLDEP